MSIRKVQAFEIKRDRQTGEAVKAPVTKYQATVRVDGVQRSKTFPTKRAAADWERATRVDRDRGDYKPPTPRSTPLLNAFTEDVMTQRRAARGPQAKEIQNSTADRYEQHLNNHILPALGHLTLNKITTEGIKVIDGATSSTFNAQERTLLRAGKEVKPRLLAPDTRAGLLKAVTMLLNVAVKDGLLSSNPASGVAPPRLKTGRHFAELEPEQLHRLIEASGPEMADMIIIAVGTGLRQSELLAMGTDHEHIDFKRAGSTT